MNSMRGVPICLLAGFLALSGQDTKQSQPQAPIKSETEIFVDVPRVPLLFTVTDKRGRFVTDLNKEDFRVFDNRRPQNILAFNRESDLPLRIGILIDTSNSVRDRLRFEQEAAIEFLRSLIKDEKDKAFLVSFDTAAELVVDFTSDMDRLAKGIRSLRAGGGTALYDAVFFACRDKLPEDSPPEQFRRALVIISDGDDNQSRISREQALEMAHRAEAAVRPHAVRGRRALPRGGSPGAGEGPARAGPEGLLRPLALTAGRKIFLSLFIRLWYTRWRYLTKGAVYG
jgi:VWFA-related protein